MKKFPLLAVILIPLTFFASCAPKYDYTAHLSEVRRDIFRAQTEEFTVTLSCISREHPYASDGVTCPKSDIAEIVLESSVDADYSVYVQGEKEWGGEMSFRSVENDWFYAQSVEKFPQASVSLRIEWNGEIREIEATSVKNEGTMSAEEVLKIAVEHEKDYIATLMQGGVFQGEFRVRLLRRDVNYYYVGIVAKDGKTLSLLLGAESGEVLARRESA